MKTSTKTYDIFFDPRVNSVVMEWNGYATSKQFKEGMELMLGLLLQNRCFKVLADFKKMIVIGLEDQEWLEKDLLPRCIRSGLKAIAIIKPDYYFSKEAINSIFNKEEEEKLTIRFFEKAQEAACWLK